MSYEEFRDKIKQVLGRASRPLTWTEIRTEAGLSQMYPNNQWVRRMEQDIKLYRQRASDGVIHWRLLTDEQLHEATIEITQSHGTRASRKKGVME
jgi:hypothetical protein